METVMSCYPNPFLIINVIEDTFDYNSFDGLLNVVRKLQQKPENPKLEVYREMILFSVIYNAFRPVKISHCDEYYGTVATIDDVYQQLSALLKIEQPVIFSKSFAPSHDSSALNSLSKNKKINWDILLEDLKLVINAVRKTMNRTAFQLVLKGEISFPCNIKELAIEYIKSFDGSLNDTNVSIISGPVSELVIFGTPFKWTNEYQFKEYLRKMEGI